MRNSFVRAHDIQFTLSAIPWSIAVSYIRITLKPKERMGCLNVLLFRKVVTERIQLRFRINISKFLAYRKSKSSIPNPNTMVESNVGFTTLKSIHITSNNLW